MSQTWRNIVVFLNQSKQGGNLLNYAADLSLRNNAFLTGACVSRDEKTCDYDRYARGMHAIQDVIKRHNDKLKAQAQRLKEAFDVRTAHRGLNAEFRFISAHVGAQNTFLDDLLCDLLVTSHPLLANMPSEWSGESLLLKSGLPVLVLPQNWDGDTVGQRIVLAWNGSREALRALTDCMPMLRKAQAVQLLVVDSGEKDSLRKQDSGKEMVQHLRQHDIAVEYLGVESGGKPVAQVILERIKAFNADLLVIGAYSRSRFREMLLGGVTVKLLSEIPVPLFVSR